ncbi:hypothetical protein GPECTOR_28g834 [Gonium pectorale]|uniref:Ankyrin repeat domain-containing protein n=1 Tax=Gonium pectorale TaxID=33097 RepID=A0A150GF29_GONPE|nr:hypothetical protein GPECTOR_28g834 [Gonium pectorale]|eukprot:KXZ48426.1 hypothetical protein GPECTOR_28g834 [Gonium pectorale]
MVEDAHLSAVAAALHTGRPGLAEWLLLRWPGRAIGRTDSLVQLGPNACATLLAGAAIGCDLATLSALHGRCTGPGGARQESVANLLPAAASSPTADWQAKVEWVESQLAPGFIRTDHVGAAAAGCPDAEARLRWLLPRGYPANGALYRAFYNGSTAAIDFLLGRGPSTRHVAFIDTARSGNLEALKKAREHGCVLEASFVASGAAINGHLPVLVWAVEELGASVQDRKLIKSVLGRCDMEVMQWLWRRGLRVDGQQVVEATVRCGKAPVLAWAVEELGASLQSHGLMDVAAASGCVELMARMRQHGCPWGARTVEEVAQGGCEAALEWLVEQGCPMPDDGMPYKAAVAHRDLATLRCLARLGCPWGPSGAVFMAGLRVGRLPVLRLLLSLGCPIDWEECLKWHFFEYLPDKVRKWLRAAEAAQRRAPGAAEEGARVRSEQQLQERAERAAQRQKQSELRC